LAQVWGALASYSRFKVEPVPPADGEC
jgi:hypothetical protein